MDFHYSNEIFQKKRDVLFEEQSFGHHLISLVDNSKLIEFVPLEDSI